MNKLKKITSEESYDLSIDGQFVDNSECDSINLFTDTFMDSSDKILDSAFEDMDRVLAEDTLNRNLRITSKKRKF
jgi:hypothetical protein